MKNRQLLLLNYENFRHDVSQLFNTLDDKPLLREAFIENPVGVLNEHLGILKKRPLSDQHVSLANKVLYSVFSNDEFFAWLTDYQSKLTQAQQRLVKSPRPLQPEESDIFDKRKIMNDLAAALVKYGDTETISNILSYKDIIKYRGRVWEEENVEPDPIGPVSGSLAVLVALVVLVVFTVVVAMVDHDHPVLETTLSASEMKSIVDQLLNHANQMREVGALTEAPYAW
jgi:hypothetical protein